MAISLVSLVALAGAAMAAPPSVPTYRITRQVQLGAPDHWDAVVFDAASHRVYVAHSDRVSVVDGQDGRIIGEVSGLSEHRGVHGIAIVGSSGKGYTDDGEAGIAVAFDLKTLKTLGRIKAKDDADAVVYDHASKHVFIINGGESRAITVIDPKTDRVIATIETGGGLEYAVAPGDGKLYVNGSEKRELIRIDTRTNTIDVRWPTADCERPHGLAFDTKSRRAFMTCLNRRMIVINSDSGDVVANVPIDGGSDAAAFDPVRRLAFSSSGDGTISVVREEGPDSFVALGSFRTHVTGRTMAIDPETGRLFVPVADVDTSGTPDPGARMGRGRLQPGSLKLLFIDPAP
jgi:YVTN family beta-propeller protein